MNKTININLAGIIFYVDEDAYKFFNEYLSNVKSKFDNTEEREEIIADIEARIAELLQQKLSDQKQVVNRQDIDEVIAVMGSPEDYVVEDDEASAESKSSSKATSGSYQYNGPKRLFRNPDDKILSGVSSGIALYFGIDPIWVRLIWVALFFGWGTGFILYIILWIVMPEAKTTAQKLQMRGEPITIDNIERTVKEEMKDVKERFQNYKSSSTAKKTGNKVRNTIEEIVSAILSILKYIIEFALKFAGVILMIGGVFVLIALFALFLGNDFNVNGTAIDWTNLSSYLSALFATAAQKSIFIIGIIMISLAPIIGLILLSMRILFNYRSKGKFTSLGLIAVLVIGFIFLFSSLAFLARGFASEATASQTIELGTNHKSYALRVTDFVDDERPYDLEWTITDKYQILTPVKLDVRGTNKEEPFIEMVAQSRGQNRLEARKRAQNHKYFVEQNDSIINLADYFLVPSDEKFRAQELKLNLYLPVGYSVYLDQTTIDMIDDIDNVTNMWDGDMIDHHWIMTQNGLACMDCANSDTETNWRNEDEWNDYQDQFEDEAEAFENEQKRLEEAELKLKEAQEEIERLKQKKK